MSGHENQEFGTHAVKKGFLRGTVLGDCLKLASEMERQGKSISIRQLLLEKGYLTQEQAAVLDSEIGHPSPKRFGRYQILQELGEGGMGRVYKAEDTELQRVVALKVLLGGFLASEDNIERFRREIKITAKLNHPNIIRVYDVGCEERQHFFTMDFVEGPSLQEMIARSPIPKRQIADIMIKVSRAIHEVHLEGIIHRDLKPANVMVDKNGEPKVMDFGLAKSARDEKKLSRTGVPMGTLQYMPPEQAIGRHKEVDEKSDVYSLGAMLYQMLAGQPPFTGKTAMEVAHQIINDDPVPPSRIKAGVPKALEVICLKAMEKNKVYRYPSAAAFADDLVRFHQGEEIEARPRSYWQRAAEKARRYRALVITGGTFVAILFTLLVYSHIQIRSEVIKTRKAEREARELYHRARDAAEEARVQEAQARLSGFTSEIARADAMLSEAEAHLAGMLTLISTEQDYHSAQELKERIGKLCDESANILSLIINNDLMSQGLKEKHRQLAERAGDLRVKSGHLEQYQIRPNLSKTVQNIAFPEGLEQVPTLDPSWKLAVLQLRGPLEQIKDQELKRQLIAQTEGRGPHSIILWDVQKDRLFKVIRCQEPPGALALSRDGRYLALGHGEKTLDIWDLSGNDRKQTVLPKGKDGIRHIAFSPGNRMLAVADGERTVIFDYPGLTPQASMPYGGKNIRAGFSEDERYFALGNLSPRFRSEKVYLGGTCVFDARQWQETKTLEYVGESLCFDTESKRVAIGIRDKIVLWDFGQKRETIWEGHKGDVFSLCYSPDGRFLASLGDDQVVMVRDVQTGKRIFATPVPKADAYSLTFCPDGSLLVSGRANMVSYRLEPLLVKQFTVPGSVRQIISGIDAIHDVESAVKEYAGIVINPSRGVIASYISLLALIWDNGTGELVYPPLQSKLVLENFMELTDSGQIKDIDVSSDGMYLASIDRKLIRVVDITHRKQIASIKRSGDTVKFHPVHPLLVSGREDMLQVWSYKEKGLSEVARQNTAQVKALCFDQDGNLMADGGESHIGVWQFDLSDPENLRSLRVKRVAALEMAYVRALCFTPHGLAAGSDNCRFVVWDWNKGEKIEEIRMPAPVREIAYDARENLYWITTITSICLYQHPRKDDRVAIYPLELYPGYLKAPMAVSPDFRYLAFLAPNMDILLFDLGLTR